MPSAHFIYKYSKCIWLLCLICVSPLACSERSMRAFESLAHNELGMISDLPEDVRAGRSSPISQCVSFKDDLMTLSLRCTCTIPGEPSHNASSRVPFRLSTLEGRVRLNRHVNAIQILDHGYTWNILFRSEQEAEKAFKLLKELIATSKAKPQEGLKRSSFATYARSAGYKYLVMAPRGDTIESALTMVQAQESPSRLMCWLTKESVDSLVPLLNESMNGLPLFIYDLDCLDEGEFFTVSSPWTTTFVPLSLGTSYVQSIHHTDAALFQSTLASSSRVGIRFTQMPDLSHPAAVYCHEEDVPAIVRKAKKLGLHLDRRTLRPTEGLYSFESIPKGSGFLWTEPLCPNSTELLRYCIENMIITKQLLSGVLYKEFPMLERLLNARSSFPKTGTISDGICRTSNLLARQTDIPKNEVLPLKLALFSHEFGAPFGKKMDLGYNSWPFALSLAEKLALSDQQVCALKGLVDGVPNNIKGDLPSILLQHAIIANDIGCPLGEWLTTRTIFEKILGFSSTDNLQTQYPYLLPFGIPRGTTCIPRPFATRNVFSTYLWEVRDPCHRDGMALRRKRNRYEKMILDNPKSSWKGRFWQWLDRDGEGDSLSPAHYLKPSERKLLQAQFLNGRLVSPAIENGIVMFVIDPLGTIYISEKVDGKGKDATSINHASIMGGMPVASAGKITLRDGKPISITNHSGHYRPGKKELALALDLLSKQGVDLNSQQCIPLLVQESDFALRKSPGI